MNILVTNDDGVTAPGLLALAQAMQTLGTIKILAPDHNWSGLRVYRDRLDRRMDPRGRPYYWIGGDTPTGIPEEGTDIGALSDGFVSITPLQLDLTAYNAIQGIGKWHLTVNNMVTIP